MPGRCALFQVDHKNQELYSDLFDIGEEKEGEARLQEDQGDQVQRAGACEVALAAAGQVLRHPCLCLFTGDADSTCHTVISFPQDPPPEGSASGHDIAVPAKPAPRKL